jgi:arginase
MKTLKRRVNGYVSYNTKERFNHSKEFKPMHSKAGKTVSLIGAPTDIGAADRGASMGPEALRVAGLAEALRNHQLQVIDRGNLVGPANPQLAPVNGYRHLEQVVTWNRLVFDAIEASLVANELPILLGGDHCLAFGSIAAVKRHCQSRGLRLKVVWLDAHADFNTSAITPSGNIHGMPVATLCGLGAPELLQLAPPAPVLAMNEIVQVGIRSVDQGEKQLVHQQGLEVFDMRSIDELSMRVVMEQVLRDVDANTHLHLSFDVDFLDPEIAPGVGTGVPGGPNYREAQLCMEMIADTTRLGSIDIMEVNPAWDVRNRTAKLAVDLIESLFGKSTLMRQRK